MPATTPKKYAFEDFTVGRQLEFGAYLVKREDILRFAAEFDPQPFHLDEAAAERSLFKGLSASGWHTCAIVMRITYDGLLADSTSLGSPGPRIAEVDAAGAPRRHPARALHRARDARP